jgi:hypothetical protein
MSTLWGPDRLSPVEQRLVKQFAEHPASCPVCQAHAAAIDQTNLCPEMARLLDQLTPEQDDEGEVSWQILPGIADAMAAHRVRCPRCQADVAKIASQACPVADYLREEVLDLARRQMADTARASGNTAQAARLDAMRAEHRRQRRAAFRQPRPGDRPQ